MPDDKTTRMSQIAEEIEALTESPLYQFRLDNDYEPVIGEGDVDASVMFIGEAPGEKEAQSGRPFVGASGGVLADLLDGIGLSREEVYITNVVKDRPPDNRDPRRAEIALYKPYLWRQIQIIEPQVIATLGRFAMEFILEEFQLPLLGEKISDLHGKPMATRVDYGHVTVLPLFHPAVALYNRNQRRTLEEDFEVLRRHL